MVLLIPSLSSFSVDDQWTGDVIRKFISGEQLLKKLQSHDHGLHKSIPLRNLERSPKVQVGVYTEQEPHFMLFFYNILLNMIKKKNQTNN